MFFRGSSEEEIRCLSVRLEATNILSISVEGKLKPLSFFTTCTSDFLSTGLRATLFLLLFFFPRGKPAHRLFRRRLSQHDQREALNYFFPEIRCDVFQYISVMK